MEAVALKISKENQANRENATIEKWKHDRSALEGFR